MSDKKITSEEIINALEKRYGLVSGTGAWVGIAEAFSGPISAGGGIDYLAIGAQRSAKASGMSLRRVGDSEDEEAGMTRRAKTIRRVKYPIVAHEIKVSRSDARRELYGSKKSRGRITGPWPYKAYFALQRSNYFFFVTPKGLFRDQEVSARTAPENNKGLWLPPEAGLIEVDGRGCSCRVAAPILENPPPMKIGDMAELIRHGINPNKLRNAQIQLSRLKFSLECVSERSHRDEKRLRWLRDEVERIASKDGLDSLDAGELRQLIEEIQVATKQSREPYPWRK